MRQGLFALLAIVALAGCAPTNPGPQAPLQPQVAQPAQLPAETPGAEAECRARGGDMRAGGLSGRRSCVVPYRDAGKDCTDGSQCEGACWTRETRYGEAVVGQCQPTSSPFGCHGEVIDGKVSAFLCVD